jgi:hypothetical protein
MARDDEFAFEPRLGRINARNGVPVDSCKGGVARGWGWGRRWIAPRSAPLMFRVQLARPARCAAKRTNRFDRARQRGQRAEPVKRLWRRGITTASRCPLSTYLLQKDR